MADGGGAATAPAAYRRKPHARGFSCRGILCSILIQIGRDQDISVIAPRDNAKSEVFFERNPLGLCELGTSTYNLGQEGAKSDLSKKLPEASLGYILRNRPTGMLLRPY